jgi:hypothetical protein
MWQMWTLFEFCSFYWPLFVGAAMALDILEFGLLVGYMAVAVLQSF